MIIGKDKNNFSTNFNTRMNSIKENANNINNQNIINNMQHTNILDKNEMNEKAFNMLQTRYNNGLITIEEFNKKCIQLGKNAKDCK